MVIEPTPRPAPIRVRVDQRFPTDDERAQRAEEEDPGGSIYDEIPDDQRSHVLLQWIHTSLEGLRDELTSDKGVLGRLEDHLYRTHKEIAGGRITVDTLEKRVASEINRAETRRADEIESEATKPLWLRILDHKAARPALGLATWLGGMASMGLLDYLGLESEPIFKLFAMLWGL